MAKNGKLTDRQETFCHEYLVDLNPRAAWIRAGYSENGAARAAKIALREDKIKGRIEQLQERRLANVDVRAEEVLLELLQIAKVDITLAFTEDGHMRPLSEIPVHVRQAIAGLEVLEEYDGHGKERTWIGYTKKVRFLDKLKALELLGKHLALFKEVHEHRVSDELADLMADARARREERERERAERTVEGTVVEEGDPEELPAPEPEEKPSRTRPDIEEELVLNPLRPQGFREVPPPRTRMRGCPKCFTSFEGNKCTHCGLEVPTHGEKA